MKQLALSKPHVLILMGIPGSGKSQFAENMANTFGMPLISREKIATISGLERSDHANVQLERLLLDEILKTGATYVYDGDTHTANMRQALIDEMKKRGYGTLTLWVQTDTRAARQRVAKRRGSNYMSEEDFDTQIGRFQPPTAKERIVVISGKHTFASQLRIVLSHLTVQQRPRPSIKPAPRTMVQ